VKFYFSFFLFFSKIKSEVCGQSELPLVLTLPHIIYNLNDTEILVLLYWIISDDQSHLMMVLGSVAHLKVSDWKDYQESTYFFSNHSFNFHICPHIVLKEI
jgi:hypothetical protein